MYKPWIVKIASNPWLQLAGRLGMTACGAGMIVVIGYINSQAETNKAFNTEIEAVSDRVSAIETIITFSDEFRSEMKTFMTDQRNTNSEILQAIASIDGRMSATGDQLK